MTTVAAAEKIILAELRDYGIETVSLADALNRVLAEPILADRDLPPYNRVAMDGIAIKYADIANGQKSFTIKGTQAAGEEPIEFNNSECIEIMTGAALPECADTVIRYEDLEINNGVATVLIDTIRQGQNIHRQGADKLKGDVVAKAGQVISSALVSVAASVGATTLSVKKLPRVVIITTGNELVDIDITPSPYEIRRSNSYAIQSVLQRYNINADIIHIPDDPAITRKELAYCIDNYDVIILSGGISAGKFDYVPQVLEELSVQKLFHKVEQRPGKPFWFGRHGNGVLVFAFPGNPVSTFMCMHRYFIPWLEKCLGIPSSKAYAILDTDFSFKPQLRYFLQVKLQFNELGQIIATPVEGNGSGDYVNLLDADAFMELPAERNNFNKGEAYPIWPFKRLL